MKVFSCFVINVTVYLVGL